MNQLVYVPCVVTTSAKSHRRRRRRKEKNPLECSCGSESARERRVRLAAACCVSSSSSSSGELNVLNCGLAHVTYLSDTPPPPCPCVSSHFNPVTHFQDVLGRGRSRARARLVECAEERSGATEQVTLHSTTRKGGGWGGGGVRGRPGGISFSR